MLIPLNHLYTWKIKFLHLAKDYNYRRFFPLQKIFILHNQYDYLFLKTPISSFSIS